MGILAAGCTTEDKAWRTAEEAGSIEAYQGFVSLFPDGAYADSARDALAVIDWELARSENSEAGYQRFLDAWPGSSFQDEAAAAFDAAVWHSAQLSRELTSLIDYSDRFPVGAFTQEAAALIDTLSWEAALRTNSIEGFRDYLQQHLDGSFRTTAGSRIQTLAWEAATAANLAADYERFADQFPGFAGLAILEGVPSAGMGLSGGRLTYGLSLGSPIYVHNADGVTSLSVTQAVLQAAGLLETSSSSSPTSDPNARRISRTAEVVEADGTARIYCRRAGSVCEVMTIAWN